MKPSICCKANWRTVLRVVNALCRHDKITSIEFEALMAGPKRAGKHRRRIACHEAGHAVVGWVFGFSEIWIEMCTRRDTRRDYRPVVWYAQAAYTVLVYGEHAAHDLYRNLLFSVAGLVAELRIAGYPPSIEAFDLLKANWHLVKRVINVLCKRDKITSIEFEALMAGPENKRRPKKKKPTTRSGKASVQHPLLGCGERVRNDGSNNNRPSNGKPSNDRAQA
jgi:hypothetical protein